MKLGRSLKPLKSRHATAVKRVKNLFVANSQSLNTKPGSISFVDNGAMVWRARIAFSRSTFFALCR
ncbi:MAG: putative 50S ribosomal subunit protein L36 [Candidatus Hodgkinia cicadicola]|nr:MAG: putative 50S ribosomal subunit protein L36 [Candidatus Hodgkinia cicadicola]